MQYFVQKADVTRDLYFTGQVWGGPGVCLIGYQQRWTLMSHSYSCYFYFNVNDGILDLVWFQLRCRTFCGKGGHSIGLSGSSVWPHTFISVLIRTSCTRISVQYVFLSTKLDVVRPLMEIHRTSHVWTQDGAVHLQVSEPYVEIHIMVIFHRARCKLIYIRNVLDTFGSTLIWQYDTVWHCVNSYTYYELSTDW